MSIKELKKLKKELIEESKKEGKKYYLVKDFDRPDDVEIISDYEIKRKIETKKVLKETYDAFKKATIERIKKKEEFSNIYFFSTKGFIINEEYFKKLNNQDNIEFTLMDITKKDIISPLVYINLYSVNDTYVPEVSGIVDFNKYAKDLIAGGFVCDKNFDTLLRNFKQDTTESTINIGAKHLTLK